MHLNWKVSLGVPGRFILYSVSTDTLDNTGESPTLVHSVEGEGIPVVLQITVTLVPSVTKIRNEGRVTVGGSTEMQISRN